MQGGGMELITVRNLVDCLETEFIGRTICGSRVDSATGQPGSEASSVMITTLGRLALSGWLAPEFGSADNQCILQQAAGF